MKSNNRKYRSIVLIEPPGLVYGLNNGLAYLSAILIEHGFKVLVLDLNTYSKHISERLQKVRNFNVIGISVKSASIKSCLSVADKVRQLNKNALIIAGGSHITLDGYNFMKENTIFDVAVIGEAEYTFLDIMNNRSLNKIKGIIYRDNGKIIINQRREWLIDLDNLLFPNYDYFDSIKKRIKIYPLLTSRGCPFHCVYCAAPVVLGKWRARDPNKVVEELIYAKGKYKIKEFTIYDDNFTLDVKRATKFCKLLIDKTINLPWSCPNGIKLTNLNEELALLMKRSGCYSVNVGIESGVEKIYNAINKGGSLPLIVKAIKLLQKQGIKVYGFFIVGLPGSTFKLDMESLRFAKKLGLEAASWDIVMPYPNTPLYYKIHKDKNYKVLHDWKEIYHSGPQTKTVFETRNYSEKERLKMYYIANLQCRFYGAFINKNMTFFEKVKNLIQVILKYDKKHFILHVYNIIKLLIESKAPI